MPPCTLTSGENRAPHDLGSWHGPASPHCGQTQPGMAVVRHWGAWSSVPAVPAAARAPYSTAHSFDRLCSPTRPTREAWGAADTRARGAASQWLS